MSCWLDTAGFENQTVSLAMGAADLVLIPHGRSEQRVGGAENRRPGSQYWADVRRRSIPYRLLLSR